jgi:hypothetical protein
MVGRPTFNQTASCVILDGSSIPWDEENNRPLDYLCEAGRLYQEALSANGMARPDPYIAPETPVPPSASRLGLMRAFKELGRWDEVRALIASDADTQEEWSVAIEIKRTDPLVQRMIVAMSLTDALVDALLIRANQLTS